MSLFYLLNFFLFSLLIVIFSYCNVGVFSIGVTVILVCSTFWAVWELHNFLFFLIKECRYVDIIVPCFIMKMPLLVL